MTTKRVDAPAVPVWEPTPEQVALIEQQAREYDSAAEFVAAVCFLRCFKTDQVREWIVRDVPKSRGEVGRVQAVGEYWERLNRVKTS